MQGGCYCGAVRYEITAAPRLRAQCHCRACQHITGGGPNYFMLIPPGGFAFSGRAPRTFTKDGLERPVTRTFCDICGTHLTTERPGLPDTVVKVGTLDNPDDYAGPVIAIFCEEMARFHEIPEGVARFDTLPPGA